MTSPRSRPNASRFHPDRTSCRHRDHRGPDRPAAAGRPGRPRGGPPDPVRQQPEADGPGPAQLREQQRRASRPAASRPTSATASPPGTQFVDGNYSTLARLLQYLEGTTIFNTVNFNYEYNHSSLGNTTAFASTLNVFICPSAVRSSSGGKEGPELGRRHRGQRRRRLWRRRLRPDGLHRHQPDRRHRRLRLDAHRPLIATRRAAPTDCSSRARPADRRDHRRHQQHHRHRRGRRPRSPLRQPLCSAASPGPRPVPAINVYSPTDNQLLPSATGAGPRPTPVSASRARSTTSLRPMFGQAWGAPGNTADPNNPPSNDR